MPYLNETLIVSLWRIFGLPLKQQNEIGLTFGRAYLTNVHNFTPSKSAQKTTPKISERKVKIAAQKIRVLMFNHRTMDGRDWADVCYHELKGMDRDGKLASTVKARIDAHGVPTGQMRHAALRVLLPDRGQFETCVKEAGV